MSHKFTVVLDAGHGGTVLADASTPNNAVGANGILEKDLTLKIARIAAAKLAANNFQTVLTRSDDRNLSLAERARKSRESGADAFVSIHFNGHKDTNVDGTEVFISNAWDEKDVALANELAQTVSLAASVSSSGVRKTNFTILKGDFHVAKTAACLIEIAYLSNPQQANKLLSPSYIEHLASAIAQSVAAYSDRISYASSLAEKTGEQTIAEVTKEHSDPKNFPIDLPEMGKGTDTINISIPQNLKFSRWEVEITALSTGAGYEVSQAPKAGAGGVQQIAIDWHHLPYGKISYKFKAYASLDGRSAATEKIVFDKAGWMEKAKDQIAQGVPLQLAVKGDKAKLIYEAIQKYQASQKGKQAGAGGVAIAMEPITITVVVLVGIVIFGILVTLGLLTLGAIIKMALDKGYNVKDTKYKAAVGEGQTKQEHEIAFNITKPEKAAETAPAQSYSFGLDDELNTGDFQPLDAVALSGEPVFDIKKSVGKDCVNLEDDIYAVKKRLIELGFDWLTLDKKIASITIDAIKLFQTIIAGKNSISGDGKIDVGKNTYSWLQAENAPRWQTMPAGSQMEGFYNYELNDTKDTHDFGTDWMAHTIRSAAAHYRDNYLKTNPSAALFTINDVSLPRGGNTPDHAGHEAGLACDLQLPKTDGKGGGITYRDSKYDRDAARGVLQALNAQSNVTNINFNDPILVKEGLCRTEPSWCEKVKMLCHDNHIHFEIKPPARGAIERNALKSYHSGGKLYQGSYQDDIDYQTHALDAACHNAKGIGKNQKFVEFKDMNIESDLPSAKEKNVCLRWNDIPANACEIDVVVHFHGYDIDEIGKKRPFFEYVEEISGLRLSKRGRPTLCILPFGRPFKMDKPEDKRIGYSFPFITGKYIRDKANPQKYVKEPIENYKENLQKLIKFSLDNVAVLNNLSEGTFKAKRLILTAHSGGGAVVANILSLKRYPVKEIHLFDAIYGTQYDPVINWAKEQIAEDANRSETLMPIEGGALRVIYEGTTLSEKIKSAFGKLTPTTSKFYQVEKTDFNHNDIPKLFGPELLGNAGATLELKKTKAKQQGLAFYDEDEINYFADREASYMNY